MCERTKRIIQYYKTLKYEINKFEALKKISTLHCEIKFKDVDDYSDRFLQTASVIEKNLSVFKAACDHVDTITTVIEHLYNVGNKLKFNSNVCTTEVNIIYLMFLICEQPEIPLFLKAALINNSKLAFVDRQYSNIISDYAFEMIVLEDSDLYAVISCLKAKRFSLLKIKTIFVQMSIKQKFLWFIEKYFKTFLSFNLPISIFQSMQELVAPFAKLSMISPFAKLNMISIWSEDIISAKKLAVTLNRDITFINAHLEFCYSMTLPYKSVTSTFNMADMNFLLCEYTDRDKINPNAATGSVYNLFYDGVWQKPVRDTYWIHNDNIYAEATDEDIMRCLQSAEKASRNWSTWPFASRVQTLLKLAHTLECNGKFLLANTVVKWTEFLNVINYPLFYYHDRRLELISIYRPKGIVSLQHCNETELFTYLTLSLIIGNCVVVICNESSCTLAPYCNMFSTSEIPPGVINLLSNKNMLNLSTYPNYEILDVVNNCSLQKYIVVSLK